MRWSFVPLEVLLWSVLTGLDSKQYRTPYETNSIAAMSEAYLKLRFFVTKLPKIGATVWPIQRLELKAPAHISVTLTLWSGYFGSDTSVISMSVGIIRLVTKSPMRVRPTNIIIMVFGSRMEGPTKISERPTSTLPQIITVLFVNLFNESNTRNAEIMYPMNKQEKNAPYSMLGRLNSASLRDNTGSPNQITKYAKNAPIIGNMNSLKKRMSV